ncbi:MAG: DoxX family membrane protein [Candidatus Krumholzibacteria bacterium]|nr:DoxX family membrane protein [Candidatus Krumholzibacteria bacterium]
MMSNESSTVASTNPLTILLTNKVFLFVLRVFLGVLMLYSSIHKAQNPDEFAIAIRGYKLLPVGFTNLFALFIAWSEAVAGIMLILGVMTRKAAGAVLILLAMFTFAIIATMVRGMVIDCGCFGSEGGHQTGTTLVIRNLFLIAAAVMTMLFDRGFWSVSTAFSRRG